MKRYFLLIGLFTVLGFNISCEKNKETDQSTKDSITILYIGDERIFHQEMWGLEACFWIFSPLVTSNGEEREVIKPLLAESWTHTDDYKTWTVKLRKDIFWHDGVQMTAEDVKFTIDLRNKISANSRIMNCELVDDFTFKFIFNKPISTLPSWEVYYPKHLLSKLDPADYYSWEFWTKPIGNGPYKFVRNIPKTMVEVEVNPNYFGKEPKIKKAIIKFSQTPSLQELLSGNVDAITYAPRDFLFKIKDDDRFKAYYWWVYWIESLFWNHNNPLFSEAKVRKALTLAIDRVELSKVLNYPDGIPITDVMNTRNQRENKDFPLPLPYDPNKAIELLKESGWRDTNADNILDKDGKDFRFTLTIGKESNLMATYIQDNFKRIGVIMDIITMERSIIKQNFKRNDFESILFRFPSQENDIVRIRSYLGEDSYLGYHSPELVSIFNQIEATGDKNEIDSLFKNTREILERDIPITFLTPSVSTYIVNSRIKGLNNLYKADPVWFLEFLWIE